MKRKTFYSKRCPRCGTKNDYSNSKCTQCGLIFSRVENGSNKLAKGLILSGQKDLTIKAPGFPKDVSKKTFMLLCGFLGFWGAHNFYVGRYIKAIFQVISGIFAVLATFFSGITFISVLSSYLFIFVAIDAFMWMFDLIDGAINKYRIPVAVDFTDGKVDESKSKKEKKTKKNNKKIDENQSTASNDVKLEEIKKEHSDEQ